jgi:imidazolonepropionase-like amidohydrolase
MLDVKAGRIIKPAGVLIQGDRIVEVIPTVKHPKGAEVIDLEVSSERTVLCQIPCNTEK